MKTLIALAIDSDENSLNLLSELLEGVKNTSEVFCASNALDGLRILESRFDINVVFVDFNLPLMNGREFLHNLAKRGMLNIPVIVTSTDENARGAAFRAGAFDFLAKPINKARLKEKIERVLAQI